MAADRSVAPTPRRIRRAHAAGVRLRSRWLVLGIACLLGAAGLDLVDGNGMSSLGEHWKEHLILATALPRDPITTVGSWPLVLAAVIALGALLAVTLATFVSGGWGPLDLRERRHFAGLRLRPPVLPSVVLALAIAFGIALVHFGVIAAAGRAVDASGSNLASLWSGWAGRLLWGSGGVLLVAGVIEIEMSRRRRWAALHQSADEAREDRRAAGSSRR